MVNQKVEETKLIVNLQYGANFLNMDIKDGYDATIVIEFIEEMLKKRAKIKEKLLPKTPGLD